MKKALITTIVLSIPMVIGCSSDKASEVARSSPNATVKVEDLIKAYADNFGKADQQYKGKVIVVEGFVEDVTNDDDLRSIHL